MSVRAAGACVLAVLVTGCGYSYGLGPGVAPEARTIAIEVVDNRSFRQGLDRPLNRALYRALAEHSSLVPASLSEADLALRTTIGGIAGQLIVQGGTPVREGGLIYAVEVELLDARSGRLLRRRTLTDRAEFRVPVGETELSASEEAADDLARKIVLALEGDI